ncbi:hypothetical protein [Fusobacterium sp. PH5-44]|uniref:hypothetical protein n=1 Tax=unclassified Fusobacterium TaxID=2648384 RepID=UPI003D258578
MRCPAEGLNQSTRQQFVIDFLKTTTLVPQVTKGIGQGINNKEKGQNIFGQLALNMGTNGAKIVIYAKDIKKELSEILKDATVIDGVLSLNMENTAEINNLLKDVLSEFGKSFYDINYVVDGNLNQLMAVNDSDGRVAINLAGIGFGNVNNLLTGIIHEGGHGTYANAVIDENAVGALTGNYVPEKNKNLILSDELVAKVLRDTAQYFSDRADGKLRDWYDKNTHKQYGNEKPSAEEVKSLAEKTGKSEEEIKENYSKHYYYWALENLNTTYENKDSFLKNQEILLKDIEELDRIINMLTNNFFVSNDINERDFIKKAVNEAKNAKTDLEDKIFTLTDSSGSLLHNVIINGEKVSINIMSINEKWQNKIGEEVVFNKSGEVIRDGVNDGTYNIATHLGRNTTLANGFFTHLVGGTSDVTMWEKYGVGEHDILTIDKRQELSKLSLIWSLDSEFKSWCKKNNITLINMEEYHRYRMSKIPENKKVAK